MPKMTNHQLAKRLEAKRAQWDKACTAVYARALHGEERLSEILERLASSPAVARYEKARAELTKLEIEAQMRLGPDVPRYMLETYLRRR